MEAFAHAFDRLHIEGETVEDATRSAPWNINVPVHEARFYLVLDGQCCFDQGTGEKRSLLTDDLLIVGEGVGGFLFAEPTVDVAGAASTVSWSSTKANATSSTRVASIRFSVRHGSAGWLARLIPAVYKIEGKLPEFRAWIKELCRLMVLKPRNEMECAAVMNRLLTILYIKAVTRAVAMEHVGGDSPVIDRFDPDIAAAIGQMHKRPEFPWTVASLAGAVGLSRSTLAARFASVIGVPPAQYLRDLRMQRAIDLLVGSDFGLKDVARQVGYKTFSAFSNAFRRCAKTSPGEYRRLHQSHGSDGSDE